MRFPFETQTLRYSSALNLSLCFNFNIIIINFVCHITTYVMCRIHALRLCAILGLVRLRLYPNSACKQSPNTNFNDSFDISGRIYCSFEYNVGITALLITVLNGHLSNSIVAESGNKKEFFIVFLALHLLLIKWWMLLYIKTWSIQYICLQGEYGIYPWDTFV